MVMMKTMTMRRKLEREVKEGDAHDHCYEGDEGDDDTDGSRKCDFEMKTQQTGGAS